MSLNVVEVKGSDLPAGATRGFQVVNSATEEILLFFHWDDDPDTRATQFADVLSAVPDRLAAIGKEGDTFSLLGQINSRFGT